MKSFEKVKQVEIVSMKVDKSTDKGENFIGLLNYSNTGGFKFLILHELLEFAMGKWVVYTRYVQTHKKVFTHTKYLRI